MRFWTVFAVLFLLTQPCYAEEVSGQEEAAKAETEEGNIQPDSQDNVAKESIEKKENAGVVLPECSDSKLTLKVKQVTDEFQAKTEASSIRDRRHQILVSKSIGKFSDEELSSFRPKDNYTVANRMITLKINGGLDEKNIKLCSSDSTLVGHKIYLLMFPENGKIKVEVINFSTDQGEGNILPFVYE